MDPNNPYATVNTYPQQNYGNPYQQPAGNTTVVVVQQQQMGRQENQLNYLTPNEERNREWEFGLFGCFGDCCVCMLSWCFFPCQECKLHAVATGEPSCTCNDFCIYTCNAPITFRCITRQQVKRRVNIRVYCCVDNLIASCCPCCAQIQEVRELMHAGLPARLCI